MIYFTPFGKVDQTERTLNGKSIPLDVVMRGTRLSLMGLYDHWAYYAAEWMYFQERKGAL